jgi:hypothetical protein
MNDAERESSEVGSILTVSPDLSGTFGALMPL